ncbi:replication protein RepA [Falsiroseomonas sp. E2-1-a20]|uniref:replication protein RepA n=1 Tax=Falsiroseomonas sp. E2-1-a20 TaxID=3239300 RepID=UPI003F310420
MGAVHQLLMEFGKEEAVKADVDRRVIEAAAAYLASEESEIGFLYSGWAQAALPHRRLPDDAPWQVITNHVTLLVQPGMRPGKPPVSIGVPYGSRARLILLYLQSEALRTGRRDISLGRSLHAWLRRLGIPIGGRSMQDVRDQAERISRCRMSFDVMQGNRLGLANQTILDTAMFVKGDGDSPGDQFIETATLSEVFFNQLKRHPVPIEESAIKQIANNSLALDVYCWLAYRLHVLNAPTPISWSALKEQFGQGFGRLDHFRKQFRHTLVMALSVYPAASVDVHERGVTLNPSPAPVAPKTLRLATVGGRAPAKR